MSNTNNQEALSGSKSLLAKHLTPEVEARLGEVKTSKGFGLMGVISSGIENPDSGVGVYLPDSESYKVFGPLVDPVIASYHGFNLGDVHQRDLDITKIAEGDLDPTGEFIVSTRIRVGRNLEGFPFAPGISPEERKEVERLIVEALGRLSGDLSGNYYPLDGMDEEVRRDLVESHFLFKEGDRFMESAGANRDWPSGRGIFHSADKKFLVWVNEEDELRVISMEQGGGVRSVFDRLVRALDELEKTLDFAFSEHLGFLSSCPSNLGTAMRASVHIRLPKLDASGRLEAICEERGLSVRGIHGEHSESVDGTYDISNKQRLGISEVEIVQSLIDGIIFLIAEEQKLKEAA